MGVSLARPSPERDTQQQWALHCSTHAQALRMSANQASPLQTERAVVEYGAAVALERAAGLWLDGEGELAQVWMRSAANVLAAALIEVPWH